MSAAKAPPVRAGDVIKLLAAKHAEDVFIPECKNGPSMGVGASMLRMDALAFRRSWANPLVTGYEVKVSRSDFLRDEKWRGYLPMCNEFYFVCPPGVIKPEEVPEPAGLLYTAGTRTLRKKKAKYRDIVMPEEVYLYILFSRARISGWDLMDRGDMNYKVEFWKKWLEQKNIDLQFGWNVGGSIKRAFAEKVEQVQARQRYLETEVKNLQEVREFMASLGLTNPRHQGKWEFERRYTELKRAVPPEMIGSVAGALEFLQKFHRELVKLENPEPTLADGIIEDQG